MTLCKTALTLAHILTERAASVRSVTMTESRFPDSLNERFFLLFGFITINLNRLVNKLTCSFTAARINILCEVTAA